MFATAGVRHGMLSLAMVNPALARIILDKLLLELDLWPNSSTIGTIKFNLNQFHEVCENILTIASTNSAFGQCGITLQADSGTRHSWLLRSQHQY
jgi:hypothetical protein